MLPIESRRWFHQAIDMLRAPRWPNEEIRRLLSLSSDSKWAEHKELSVKPWMCSTGPLPKTSGLSTPFKAAFPITFTQRQFKPRPRKCGEKKKIYPLHLCGKWVLVGIQKFHTSLKIASTWVSSTSNDVACFLKKVDAKKYERRRTGDIISCGVWDLASKNNQ